MKQNHLTDDQLAEMCIGGSDGRGPDRHEHLFTCASCELRRVSLEQLLVEVSASAEHDADAAFPADRLQRQHSRILQRIEQDGRPGRVIAFPAGAAHGPSLLRSHATTRWVAAAAAAAFVVGLLAGHLSHILPGQRFAQVSPVVARATNRDGVPAGTAPRPTATSLRTAAIVPVSDDEFLDEIEIAVESGGPAALRRIDALTPRAWESR